ncbi:hypothetical protein EV426DRAFT_626216 [Tirmania nivea]|nr:hypothetical protein EV426DRAFT_626216 [Tirmania nivea]
MPSFMRTLEEDFNIFPTLLSILFVAASAIIFTNERYDRDQPQVTGNMPSAMPSASMLAQPVSPASVYMTIASLALLCMSQPPGRLTDLRRLNSRRLRISPVYCIVDTFFMIECFATLRSKGQKPAEAARTLVAFRYGPQGSKCSNEDERSRFAHAATAPDIELIPSATTVPSMSVLEASSAHGDSGNAPQQTDQTSNASQPTFGKWALDTVCHDRRFRLIVGAFTLTQFVKLFGMQNVWIERIAAIAYVQSWLVHEVLLLLAGAGSSDYDLCHVDILSNDTRDGTYLFVGLVLRIVHIWPMMAVYLVAYYLHVNGLWMRLAWNTVQEPMMNSIGRFWVDNFMLIGCFLVVVACIVAKVLSTAWRDRCLTSLHSWVPYVVLWLLMAAVVLLGPVAIMLLVLVVTGFFVDLPINVIVPVLSLYIGFQLPIFVFYGGLKNVVRVALGGRLGKGNWQWMSPFALAVDDRVFTACTAFHCTVYYFVYWDNTGVTRASWTEKLG